MPATVTLARLKSLETKHRTNPRLHAAMVLFNDVIEIFRGPQLGLFPKPILLRQFADSAMGSSVAVKRYDTRRTTLRLQRLPEK